MLLVSIKNGDLLKWGTRVPIFPGELGPQLLYLRTWVPIFPGEWGPSYSWANRLAAIQEIPIFTKDRHIPGVQKKQSVWQILQPLTSLCIPQPTRELRVYLTITDTKVITIPCTEIFCSHISESYVATYSDLI